MRMKRLAGGYLLINPRKHAIQLLANKSILTCSTCINDSLLDFWAFPLEDLSIDLEDTANELKVTHNKLIEIQDWIEGKAKEGKISPPKIFNDLETVVEYERRFFMHYENSVILKIVFPEAEAAAYLQDFAAAGKEGFYQNLKVNLEVKDLQGFEEKLGYDLIGPEYDSATCHTFHCHQLANKLIQKFSVKINEYGLLEEIHDTGALLNYMNDEKNGFEPVPWYLVEVMRVKKHSLL